MKADTRGLGAGLGTGVGTVLGLGTGARLSAAPDNVVFMPFATFSGSFL